MLLNICSESQGLEGLLAGNELQALLIATTCLREHSCCFWKEPTFCVLRAISQAQDLSVIQYLQGRSPGSTAHSKSLPCFCSVRIDFWGQQ